MLRNMEKGCNIKKYFTTVFPTADNIKSTNEEHSTKNERIRQHVMWANTDSKYSHHKATSG